MTVGELGDLLSLWRDTYGYERDETAEIVGLSRQQIGRIEAGVANLSVRQLSRLADETGTPLSRMLIAFLLMDDNIDKIDGASDELCDRLITTIHQNLAPYRRARERDSIARQIMTSPMALNAALSAIIQREDLAPKTPSIEEPLQKASSGAT